VETTDERRTTQKIKYLAQSREDAKWEERIGIRGWVIEEARGLAPAALRN